MSLNQEERRYLSASSRYAERCGGPVPQPFGVPLDLIAEALEEALEAGSPLPDNFDWYPGDDPLTRVY